MGSPKNPGAAQIAELEQATRLALLGKPVTLQVKNQQATVRMQLPRQGVPWSS